MYMYSNSIFHEVLAVTSYEEFVLKCAIWNIDIPNDFKEEDFERYFRDDWKWYEFANAIANGYVSLF